ncbi:MAG: CCA tRNA nucleotidyltransferase [Planctomycetota bacterium]
MVHKLQQNGHQAVFAGGCVRDAILGHVPRDYDIATTARPDKVQCLFSETRAVGRDFGVILVLVDGDCFEVATFRTETGYSDGRRPDQVQFAGVKEDAQRRDFTINAMYWNPLSGKLIDHVGGLADIRDRLVRAVGQPSRRFQEDHLRLIRAVRFAARLNFRLTKDTEKALRENVDLITGVAAERLQQELRVIMTDRDPASALRLMDDIGMLGRLFPELDDARGCEQPDNYHPEGDVFVHSLLTVQKLGPCPDFVVAMAALLHDIGKPPASEGQDDLRFPEHERIGEKMVREVCQRLKLPTAETDRIAWLTKRHMYFKDAKNMNDSTLKQLIAESGFKQLCQLVRADSLASWGQLENLEYVLQKREQFQEKDIAPPRLISGNDLIDMGYKPGPAFTTILETIRDEQLNGTLSSREQALQMARQIARKIDAPQRETT